MEENKKITSKIKSFINNSFDGITSLFSPKKQEYCDMSQEIATLTAKSAQLEQKYLEAEKKAKEYRDVVQEFNESLSYILDDDQLLNENLELKKRNQKLISLVNALKEDLSKAVERVQFYKVFAKTKLEGLENKLQRQKNNFVCKENCFMKGMADFVDFLREKQFYDLEVEDKLKKIFIGK